jgi:hypothetical protein
MADYPYVTTGNVYTTVDTYNSALLNNGAVVPPGSEYSLPINGAAIPTTGQGWPLTIKYVRYLSTAADNFIASPGLVYFTDETGTVVSGNPTDGSSFGINAIAGWCPINTTNYPGSLTGAQLLAAVKGNFIWIITGGFIAGARSAASVAKGDYLIGSTSAFLPARMVAGTAPTNTVAGMALSAVASNLSDILVKGFGIH